MATSLQPAVPGILFSGAELNDSLPSRGDSVGRATVPLSPTQKLLCVLDRVFPNTTANNLLLRIAFKGQLDTECLRQTLRELVSDTPSLRMRLLEGSAPSCELIPFPDPAVRSINLTGRGRNEQEADLSNICKGETATPFNGTTLPRATLVCLSPDDHVLILAVTEIAVSRGRLPQLFSELMQRYAGTPRKRITADTTSKPESDDAAYWKSLLSHLPAINLPLDWSRSAIMNFRGAREEFTLSPDLTRRLAGIADGVDTDLATALLTGVTMLLHRYTAQEDIVVGSTSRPGDFLAPAAPMVLRTQVSPADTFLDLLAKTRDAAATAARHSRTGLDCVLSHWRDPSRHPVFQVGFEMLDEFPSVDLPGLSVRAEEVATGSTRLDLNFILRKTTDGVRGQIDYNQDLFEPATIRRMTEHLAVLIESACESPGKSVGQLSILPGKERKQVLEEWNATEVEFEDQCIHQLFERQVHRTPDDIALVFRGEEFTYRELNERADCLANHLRARGVAPDTLVGVCVERSPAMLLAQVAILKAGGAYVPLDPVYPRDRLAFMATDAHLALLITQRHLAGGFDLPESRVLCIDEFQWDAASPDSPNQANATPENLAYVIYTSGSTGKPKGVMLTHRNVANFFAGMDAVIGREPGVWLAVTSICFDISVLELFWTLSRGFKVVLQPDKQAVESMEEAIPAQIVRHKVTHFQCTPSLATILLQEPDGLGALRTVCKVLLGGEPLPAWLSDKLTDAIELINVYGPTETTVWSSACQVRAGEPITIGRPIANTQIYILDANLQPTPIGVPGEIYIGGTGTARGYLNRTELTAERFIRNPFAGGSGARIYRTGDLGRFLPDGRIECLGRVDFQVKVRGFRIELGEIENALREHPLVQEAVVTVRDYGAGDKRLVAYCVGKNHSAADAHEIRHFLKDRMPEYMVPSAFVTLKALPLTPNGKVDRKGLPAPEAGDVRPGAPLKNSYEKAMAGIWREVLGAEDVNGDSNFFNLGGNALLILQVQHLIIERLGANVTPLILLQNPVLSAQAQIVAQARAIENSTTEWLPLTEAQKEVWLASQKSDEASCVFNISRVLHLAGRMDIEDLTRCIQTIVDRHESLRTTFKPDGAGQRILARMAARVQTHELIPKECDQQFDELLRMEAETAFDLVSGPLVRWHIVSGSDLEHFLVLTVHHLVADAMAVDRIFEELAATYAGKDVPEPTPLRTWLDRNGAKAGSVEYWLSEYADAPAPAELPTDHARPSETAFKGEIRTHKLPQGLSHRLQSLAAEEKMGLDPLLLAAYGAFVHKLTCQDENVIGLRVQSAQPVVADRVAFLPLRVRVNDGIAFVDYAREVEATYKRAVAHADFPYGSLVQQLSEAGQRERIPAVSVGLAIRQSATTPVFGGLEATLSMNPHIRTNLDLALEVVLCKEEWRLNAVFNCEILDASTVQRWLQHFQTLLEAIAAQPAAPVGELPLLTPGERREIVEEWNATDLAYARELCLHQRFEQQASETPQATALICGDRFITYAELNARANQLARYLRKQGVRADELVGVWLDRSEDLLVALLAILKSGAAYLPLDAGYPRERLQYMLEDTRAALLITQRHWREYLPPHSAKVICVDELTATLAAEEEGELHEVKHNSNNLAYVIYTSGSTGRPKGVAIEHASATAFVHWAREVFTPEELGGVFASTSVCFDLSIFELFVPLSWGGTVVLAENVMELPNLPAREKVTLVNTVPSAAGDLLRSGGIPSSVTTFALAGEPLTTRLVEDLYALPNVQRVYDLYGPSETTTYSTFTLRRPGSRATVGKPLANSQVYILDPQLQPMPIGVPGEICIGGAGVARGYLNLPEATTQRFLPDPFRPGSRIYRTGDLGRWLPNGDIEFLGRRDHQVKLRGYRIELGEIESVMSAHPSVREAAAIVRQEGGKVLAGYAVIDPQSGLTGSEFRQYLRQKLPDYMVPTSLVFLDAMPRTPSGKVNRKALPAPAQDVAEGVTSSVAELNPIEETLAQIWREVIGLPTVRVEDNFFDLGGHSVLVVQVIARVRSAFQVDLSLRNVFEAPTLSQLAGVIEGKLIEQIEQMPEGVLEQA